MLLLTRLEQVGELVSLWSAHPMIQAISDSIEELVH